MDKRLQPNCLSPDEKAKHAFYTQLRNQSEVTQVRTNKDASEGRDENRITEIDLPDLIAGCLLQIFCMYIAGFFAGYL